MRILFLHTASNGLTAEYKVHATLAMNAGKNKLDPYFVWQSPIELDQITVFKGDFGRNLSIDPRPSRVQRAGMMIQKLPRTLASISSIIRQTKPDLIYTSQQEFDVRLASLFGQYFHIPHVIHLHYSVGPWLGKFALNAIRKSTRLLAVSEYVRETALLQGVKPASIHTIVNPAPFNQNSQSGESQNVRAEFHLKEDALLVLSVGRLDPGKGHIPLINAFARVVQQLPESRLLICGSSTTRDGYEASIRRHVTNLHLDPYVIFTGYRKDIPAIMRSSNVFCLPTELDPCPLVFFEAMSEGLPIVAFYSGGIPELVVDHQTGLLSYPSDETQLAENLIRVLIDPVYARRLGEAGKQRVASEFAPEKVAPRWLNVLEGMVGIPSKTN